MKILFLSKDYSYNGGGERMLCNLANSLSKNNEISIVSFDYTDKSPLYKLNNSISFIKANIQRRKISFFTKFDYCKWLIQNKDLVNSYDFVIGVGIICNLVLATVSNKLSTKMLAWEHCSYSNVPFYQKILRYILFRNLSAVVVLTYQDLPKYQKLNKNTLVIYNFTQMKPVLRTTNRNKVFIWIGRLSQQKGIEYLKEIIRKFCKINSEWKFRIIGKGENQKEFIDFIKEEKLENRIIYEEESNKVQEELDNSGCMLMTSLAEGLPMVLIEAQTRGIPAISFDTETGPREIIKDGKTGYIVSCYNTDLFIEKMLQFAESIDIQNDMSNNCFNGCITFSEEQKISEWIQFFEEIKTI